jgi:acyl carrier protein
MNKENLNIAIAEEFEIEVSDITPDAPIKETLDLDSLSLLDLITVVERETGVKLSGTEAVKLLTFQALYDHLGL